MRDRIVIGGLLIVNLFPLAFPELYLLSGTIALAILSAVLYNLDTAAWDYKRDSSKSGSKKLAK